MSSSFTAKQQQNNVYISNIKNSFGCGGKISSKVESLLRGHPDERPPPLERPLDNVNLNINVLISTPDERPPLLKGHFSGEKGWPHKRGSTV